MLLPAQLLRSWLEQQPRKQSVLDSSITGEVGRVYFTEVDLLLISFVYHST
jgi:hypothetical protein